MEGNDLIIPTLIGNQKPGEKTTVWMHHKTPINHGRFQLPVPTSTGDRTISCCHQQYQLSGEEKKHTETDQLQDVSRLSAWLIVSTLKCPESMVSWLRNLGIRHLNWEVLNTRGWDHGITRGM